MPGVDNASLSSHHSLSDVLWPMWRRAKRIKNLTWKDDSSLWFLDWFPNKSKEGRSPSDCHPYSTFPGMGWSLPLLSSSAPSPGRKNKWDVVLFRSLPESLSVAGFFSSDSKLKSPWATVLFTVLLLWRVTLTKAAYGRKHFIGRLFTISDG